jgi:hypothetical protein
MSEAVGRPFGLSGGGGPLLEPPPARQHRKMKRGIGSAICAHGVAHSVVAVAALGCLVCAVLHSKQNSFGTLIL